MTQRLGQEKAQQKDPDIEIEKKYEFYILVKSHRDRNILAEQMKDTDDTYTKLLHSIIIIIEDVRFNLGIYLTKC